MVEQSKNELNSTMNYDPDKDHSECMRILNLVLDGEANHEENDFFKQKLENCMPYYQIYNVDMAIKELIKKVGYERNCPDGLVDEIKAKIKTPAQPK